MEKIFAHHLVSLISWSLRWFTLEVSPGAGRISFQLAVRRCSCDLSKGTWPFRNPTVIHKLSLGFMLIFFLRMPFKKITLFYFFFKLMSVKETQHSWTLPMRWKTRKPFWRTVSLKTHKLSQKFHLWEFILRKLSKRGAQDEGGQPSLLLSWKHRKRPKHQQLEISYEI